MHTPSKSSAAKSAAFRRSEERHLRERACAQHLDISHRTLEDWRKKGLVPYLRITSRSIRYRLGDVLQALRDNYGQEVKK
jgi:predicted site-specific integrase-resolvase